MRGPGWTALILICLLLAGPVAADPPVVVAPESVGLDPEPLNGIRPVLQELVGEGQLAGAVVAVARHGKIALLEAVGQRDLATSQPMQADTIVRLYSMSKPVTSAGLLILVDEGELGLDDPVSRYLPAFSEGTVLIDGEEVKPVRPPTIRDLLRHTSGLTYGFGLTQVTWRYHRAGVFDPEASLAEICDRLGQVPLAYQPGTRWQYSLSVDVAGRVIEVVSGQPLDAFLEEKLFQPLGMTDTGFYVPEEALDRLATFYRPTLFRGLQPIDAATDSPLRQPPNALWGGAGLVSTAGDYLRFIQLLLNRGRVGDRQLLSAESVRLMTTNQLPEGVLFEFGLPTASTGFGLGLSVVLADDDPARIGECGWAGAASTNFFLHPEEQLAVVVLTQQFPMDFQAYEVVRERVYQALAAGRAHR